MRKIALYKKLNGVKGNLPFFEAVQVLIFGEIKVFAFEIEGVL